MTPGKKIHFDDRLDYFNHIIISHFDCSTALQLMETSSLKQWLKTASYEQEYFEDLTFLEYQQLLSYRLYKRKAEFLSGRKCAKQSACDLLGNKEAYQQLSIETEPSGRPRLVGKMQLANIQLPDISISHSANLTCALACNNPCGIDIQLLTPSLMKVEDRFCTDLEKTLLNHALKKQRHITELSLPPLTALGLIWSAKEAIKKAATYNQAPMPGFLDIALKASIIQEQTAPSPAVVHLSFLVNTDREIQVSGTVIDNSYVIAATIISP